MMIVENDIVIAHGVEDGAGIVIAEDRRIALDERVHMLLRQQIGRNALDLIGRATVQRRERDTVRDLRRDGSDKLRFLREQLRQDLAALGKHRQLRSVLHGFDVMIDLRTADALEIIADMLNTKPSGSP